MASPSCRLSIVTPTLNCVSTIADAVESVLAQGRDDVEHLVMDGGSTDGTLKILERYPTLRVYSAPDINLYEALNRGIGAARGEVIGLLNGDDVYLPGAFDSVLAEFTRCPTSELVSGGAEFCAGLDRNALIVGRINGRGSKLLEADDVIRGVPIINARFMTRSLFSRVGLFDTNYRIAADVDFLLRVVADGVSRSSVSDTVYCYRMHESSMTLGSAERLLAAREECVHAAEVGLSRARIGTRERELYARWHAWSTGYLLLRRMRRGEFSTALRIGARASAFQPSWLLVFAQELWPHYRKRWERRWSDA